MDANYRINRPSTPERGFTLLELLVVMVTASVFAHFLFVYGQQIFEDQDPLRHAARAPEEKHTEVRLAKRLTPEDQKKLEEAKKLMAEIVRLQKEIPPLPPPDRAPVLGGDHAGRVVGHPGEHGHGVPVGGPGRGERGQPRLRGSGLGREVVGHQQDAHLRHAPAARWSGAAAPGTAGRRPARRWPRRR